MHIVLKAEFFQRELGIKAGLPNLSCRFIQKINAGIRAAAKQRSTMFEVFRILDKLAVIAANRYDEIPRQELDNNTPTQSISVASLLHNSGAVFFSRGNMQELTAKSAIIAPAHR